MPTIKNTDNASTGEDVEQRICLEGMQNVQLKWYSLKSLKKNKTYIYTMTQQSHS